MKKLLSTLLAITLMAGTIAGCSSSQSPSSQENPASGTQSAGSSTAEQPAEKVTLSFWYTANDANPSDYVAKWQKNNVSTFTEKYPNIIIEPSVISDGNQYLTKITTEIAANNAPDVFQTWLSGRLEPFVTANRVHPLNDIIDANPDLKAVLSDSALSLATFDGKVYALPGIASGEVIYYNKKIFADLGLEVPKTYEDLKNIVKVCNDNGFIPMAMGNDCVWLGSVPYMAYFQRMYGNDLYEEVILGKNAKFTDPEFIEAANELKNMTEMGMFTPNANAVKPEESQASFKEGKAAMSFDGTWRLPVFYDAIGDDLGFFNFPDVEGGKGDSSVWLVNFDNSIAISESSQHKDEAAQFLCHIFSKERQKELGEYGQLLATKGIELDKEKLSEVVIDLNEAMASSTYAYVPWDNPLGTNLGTEFNKATQGVIGGKDPTEMFTRLNEAAKMEWAN